MIVMVIELLTKSDNIGRRYLRKSLPTTLIRIGQVPSQLIFAEFYILKFERGLPISGMYQGK